jgi:hypothetical protein
MLLLLFVVVGDVTSVFVCFVLFLAVVGDVTIVAGFGVATTEKDFKSYQ